MGERPALECGCCGDVGAWADDDGLFGDGDPLVCGCPGQVSIDPDAGPWINNFHEPCAQCDAALAAWEAAQR